MISLSSLSSDEFEESIITFPSDNSNQSTIKKTTLPQINISPRRYGRKYFNENEDHITPPSTPTLRNPNQRSPDKYQIRVLGKCSNVQVQIMEHPNDNHRIHEPSPIPDHLAAMLRTPENHTSENDHQISPQRSSPITNRSSKPITPPRKTKRRRRARHANRPARKNVQKVFPEDYRARVVESENNELVAVLVEKGEYYRLPAQSRLPRIQTNASTHENEPRSPQQLQQRQQTSSYSSLVVREESHLPSINRTRDQRSPTSSRNEIESTRTFRFGAKQTPQFESQSFRDDSDSNDAYQDFSDEYDHDHCHRIISSSSDDLLNNSCEEKCHWDTEEIEDREGPWRNYYITANDVLDDGKCPICFNDFEIGERTVKLNCDHIFHEDCILVWYNQNKLNPTCPLCRKNMNVSDEYEELYD